MKTTQAILGAVLIASIATPAMAGSFGKNKRKFNRAKKITAQTFETKILGKTFRCEGYFSDNTSGSEYYQFNHVHGKIINHLDDSTYELNKTLVATENRSIGDINVYFRLTKDNELVAYQDSGYTSQYIYCPASETTTTRQAKLETILDQKIDTVAVSATGIKIVITTRLETAQNGQTEHKNYIHVLSEKNEILLTQSSEAFLAKLGLDENFNRFPPSADLIEYAGEFYISGTFYKKDYGIKKMAIKFDASLTSPKVVVEGQEGELKINPINGDLGFYGFDNENRGATKVSVYTNDGKLISTNSYPEMRETTGFEGTTLTNGNLVIASYCDSDYNSLYGCPERNINYSGVSLVDTNGSLIKFFTGMGKLDMAKATIIKALKNGEFLVGFERYNDIITLVKYSADGKILNSYGLDATVEENNSIAIKPDSQKEKISITDNGAVYFSQGNRIYSFKL